MYKTAFFSLAPILAAFHLSMIVLWGLLALVSGSTMGAQVDVVQSSSAFSKHMYDALGGGGGGGNLLFSPFSIHAVLAMAHQGAAGDTARALEAALQVPSADGAAEGYLRLLSHLGAVRGVDLAVANRIFVKDDVSLRSGFEARCRNFFLSDVQPVNFANGAAAVDMINSWIKERTHNKIRDLLKSDDVNSDTRLVLVNTIYFSGKWLNTFFDRLTRSKKFQLDGNRRVEVPMMYTVDLFRFKRDKNLRAEVVELPFTNENANMIVVLPNENSSIADLEKRLVNMDLKVLKQGLERHEVRLGLPRFRIEKTIDLEQTLRKMGLGEIFDNKANFSGMLQTLSDLYVSKAVQKVYVDVNEVGVEAAGVTESSISNRIIPPEIIVNRPFLFFIEESNTILFIGRIMNPTMN